MINYVRYIGFFVLGAIFGCFLHSFTVETPKPIVKVEKEYINVPVEAKTKTIIKYVEKDEKQDVEVNIPKTKLNVKVNNKNYEFEKANNEKQLFEKNKLQLDQESKVDINIKVPIVHKRWGLGVGYSVDEKSPAYIVKFPIKSDNLDGWIYKSDEDLAAGVMIGF